MEYLPLVTTAISIISIIFCILTFAINRNKDAKSETENQSYKQGKLDEQLKNIFEKLENIEKKLDTYDIEIDDRIEKAMQHHIAIYHDKERSNIK